MNNKINNNNRSSLPVEFCKKVVLENFAKFTEKHLCQRLWQRCCPVNFLKFLRTLLNTSAAKNNKKKWSLTYLSLHCNKRLFFLVANLNHLDMFLWDQYRAHLILLPKTKFKTIY